VIARAEGEAQRFEDILKQYEKAPEVMRQRLYLDAVQTALTNSSKILIDTKNGNPMFYIPLDKMIMPTAKEAIIESMPSSKKVESGATSSKTDMNNTGGREQ
jgi:membrane protease subunit HflK